MPSHQYLHNLPVGYPLQNLPGLFVILIFSFCPKTCFPFSYLSSSQIENNRFFCNLCHDHDPGHPDELNFLRVKL